MMFSRNRKKIPWFGEAGGEFSSDPDAVFFSLHWLELFETFVTLITSELRCRSAIEKSLDKNSSWSAEKYMSFF